MSHHDAARYPQYNTPAIREALKQHGLAVDTPSQLSDSFRHGYLAALASAPPAAGAQVASAKQLVREWYNGTAVRDLPKWAEDAVLILHVMAAAPQPAEPAQPATQAGAGELPDQMDAIALARFKVQPTTSGYWGWCVKAGDGDAELYKGHKSDCELVARRMLGAFLDGGHKALELLAAQPTEQPSQDANPPR